MTRDSRSGAIIKGQPSKYSGIISRNLSKAKQRLIQEMLYGIQAGKDIKLTCITRALHESIPLLSRRRIGSQRISMIVILWIPSTVQ